MAQVFISYLQTDDQQKQRVRPFAEQLRNSGIDVSSTCSFATRNLAQDLHEARKILSECEANV